MKGGLRNHYDKIMTNQQKVSITLKADKQCHLLFSKILPFRFLFVRYRLFDTVFDNNKLNKDHDMHILIITGCTGWYLRLHVLLAVSGNSRLLHTNSFLPFLNPTGANKWKEKVLGWLGCSILLFFSLEKCNFTDKYCLYNYWQIFANTNCYWLHDYFYFGDYWDPHICQYCLPWHALAIFSISTSYVVLSKTLVLAEKKSAVTVNEVETF